MRTEESYEILKRFGKSNKIRVSILLFINNCQFINAFKLKVAHSTGYTMLKVYIFHTKSYTKYNF